MLILVSVLSSKFIDALLINDVKGLVAVILSLLILDKVESVSTSDAEISAREPGRFSTGFDISK